MALGPATQEAERLGEQVSGLSPEPDLLERPWGIPKAILSNLKKVSAPCRWGAMPEGLCRWWAVPEGLCRWWSVPEGLWGSYNCVLGCDIGNLPQF